MAGTLRIAGGELTIPSNTIVNEDISSTAAIQSSKLLISHKPTLNFSKNVNTDPPTAREEIIYVAHGAATVTGCHCLLWDTGTSTDVTFTFRKYVGGVSSVLATQTITDADSDKEVFDPTVSAPTLTVDDIVTVEVTFTATTGALGPCAWVSVEEQGITTT